MNATPPAPDPDTLRAAVEHVARAAALHLDFQGQLHEVTLHFRGGREIVLAVPSAGGQAPDDLTPTEAAAVAVLRAAAEPLKATTIAARARLVYNPHFRRAMSQLQKRGVVERVAGQPRYQLARR